MGRNDYDQYLAHSKGPWKKHKYIKKVGNRYYYAGSKGYYKALATTDDPNVSASQKKAAQKINAKRATSESLKRAARKNKVNNVKKSASDAVSSTAKNVKGRARLVKANASAAGIKTKQAAKKTYRNASASAAKLATNTKGRARLLKANASAAGIKAKQATKKAYRNAAANASSAASKLAKNSKGRARLLKANASATAIKAKQASKRNARKALASVSAATKYGKSAISKLLTNAKGRARLVKANASAASIKRKQARRKSSTKKA